MPIYAFECTRCGHRFDRLQRLSDADPTTCPACAAEGEVRRQLTAPSFRLAGGGWYETDFKKDGDRKRNLADKADAPAAPAAEPAKPAAGNSPAAAPSSAPTPSATPKAAPSTAPVAKPPSGD